MVMQRGRVVESGSDRPGAGRSAAPLHAASGQLGAAGMTVMLRTEALAKLHPAPAGRRAHSRARRRRLEVRRGECVALAGPSGAGKSTLMRSLYGNYRADGGRILVRHRGDDGRPRRRRSAPVLEVRRETLGYVSQFLRVVPRVPALDIVAEARSHAVRHPMRARARGAIAAAAAEHSARLHALPPATFSGGEQQRVNLARGFIGWPPDPAARRADRLARCRQPERSWWR